jgi:hypothetical protein
MEKSGNKKKSQIYATDFLGVEWRKIPFNGPEMMDIGQSSWKIGVN